MKVIDIYNKIANGEKVPNFIIDEQEYYIGADGVLKSYFGDEVEWCVHKDWLNEEVQIIEEVEDKEYEDIEELKIEKIYKCDDYQQIYINFKDTWNKINDLIRNQKKIIERLDK